MQQANNAKEVPSTYIESIIQFLWPDYFSQPCFTCSSYFPSVAANAQQSPDRAIVTNTISAINIINIISTTVTVITRFRIKHESTT